MNSDDFEHRLRQLQPPVIPAAWRAEILETAEKARAAAQIEAAVAPPSWRDWFWPCPQAWAGLAAVWVAILVFNYAGRGMPEGASERIRSPGSQPDLAVLFEQQRKLSELLEQRLSKSTPAPKSSDRPGPRAQLQSGENAANLA